MTRFLSGTNQTESSQPSIRMSVLADLDFSSGHLRVHDSYGTLSFGGNDYLGVGTFGGIDGAVDDSIEVIARPIKLILSGVDSSILSSAMTEDYQGRSVSIYLGFLQEEDNSFIATPETIWEGRMDYMEIEIGQDTGSVRLNCEHRLRREPRIARYTDEDQQILYPGDTFFKYLSYIQGFKSQWGDKPTSFITAPDQTRFPRGPSKDPLS